MADSLTEQLRKAGVSCRALAAWCRCKDGHEDLCEQCILGGPAECDARVVAALVKRIVTATEQTDVALQMVKYWQGLCGRHCDVVMK